MAAARPSPLYIQAAKRPSSGIGRAAYWPVIFGIKDAWWWTQGVFALYRLIFSLLLGGVEIFMTEMRFDWP